MIDQHMLPSSPFQRSWTFVQQWLIAFHKTPLYLLVCYTLYHITSFVHFLVNLGNGILSTSASHDAGIVMISAPGALGQDHPDNANLTVLCEHMSSCEGKYLSLSISTSLHGCISCMCSCMFKKPFFDKSLVIGPLFKAVRGNGFAYSTFMAHSLSTGEIFFHLLSASDPVTVSKKHLVFNFPSLKFDEAFFLFFFTN